MFLNKISVALNNFKNLNVKQTFVGPPEAYPRIPEKTV